MNRQVEYAKSNIPFNKPHLVGNEIKYIIEAHSKWRLAGDNYFTKKCHTWLEKNLNANKALLTHSCTAALEIMGLLLKEEKNTEVIMPSFTFVTTASAFVLRNITPVFVDIRPDTLNINEKLVEQAITPRTRAIMAVHYAGVSCEMNELKRISKKNNLILLEDAAQAMMSKYNNQYLGTIGDLGALSFHETKNIISGEGGSLLVNNNIFSDKAEIIREKGTNRSAFYRGEVDKYTWVGLGSSYLPGEIIAAFLYAQFKHAKRITRKRLRLWQRYHSLLEKLESKGNIRRPTVPTESTHNGHMYYILVDPKIRQNLVEYARKYGILPVFHYVPLHSSPAGKKYTKTSSTMKVTDRTADSLIRLPLYYEMTNNEIDRVVDILEQYFK